MELRVGYVACAAAGAAASRVGGAFTEGKGGGRYIRDLAWGSQVVSPSTSMAGPREAGWCSLAGRQHCRRRLYTAAAFRSAQPVAATQHAFLAARTHSNRRPFLPYHQHHPSSAHTQPWVPPHLLAHPSGRTPSCATARPSASCWCPAAPSAASGRCWGSRSAASAQSPTCRRRRRVRGGRGHGRRVPLCAVARAILTGQDEMCCMAWCASWSHGRPFRTHQPAPNPIHRHAPPRFLTSAAFLPAGLMEALITGGLPPGITLPCSAEAAYRALHRRVLAANAKYYDRWGGEVGTVRCLNPRQQVVLGVRSLERKWLPTQHNQGGREREFGTRTATTRALGRTNPAAARHKCTLVPNLLSRCPRHSPQSTAPSSWWSPLPPSPQSAFQHRYTPPFPLSLTFSHLPAASPATCSWSSASCRTWRRSLAATCGCPAARTSRRACCRRWGCQVGRTPGLLLGGNMLGMDANTAVDCCRYRG